MKPSKIHMIMKSSVSNSSLAFIILFWTMVGLISGCASSPSPAVKSDPVVKNSKEKSGSVKPKPYRVNDRVYYPKSDSAGFTQKGNASWYGKKFHGRRTANGEVYDMHGLTAAHKTLPFNTVVEVTHQKSGKTVQVRVNDRGPFAKDRIIDLSYGAARKLGIIKTGTAPVRIRVTQDKQSSVPRDATGAAAQKGIYSVQVGVFENLDNARRISRKFRRSRILAVKQSNRKFYKVLVGKYSNYENALGPMDRIRLHGFEEAFIVLSP